ncbi:MAG: Mov34/MPN/PAD-1 family protein [Deltaproteobacteria bacterium]
MIHKKLIITEDAINSIVNESNRHEKVETGGLLFGKIIGECIIIVNIIHLSTNAKRTQVYFEMDEDLAINITKQMEKNNLAYLGNWHKHLGYGGPSNGDDKQAELFLIQNSHKRNYLSLIIDFCNNNYNLIATNYYFDKDEFIKKDLEIQKIIDIQELDKILKGQKINITNYIENLSRKIEDHTGKKFTYLQPNKSHNYKLTYEERYDRSDYESILHNKFIYSIFINFPNIKLSFTDKISIGVTLDYKHSKILEEISFSDIFFNKVEILPKIQNMLDKSPHYIELLSSHLENNTKNDNLKSIIKRVFTALKTLSVFNLNSQEKKIKNVKYEKP